jgi:hypothetical protein
MIKAKRMILVAAGFVFASSVYLHALGQAADGSRPSTPAKNHHPHFKVYPRITKAITELEGETLEQSLMGLDDERSYRIIFGIPDRSYHWMTRLMHNRCFKKVLTELAELHEWERAELLSKHLKRYWRQSDKILNDHADMSFLAMSYKEQKRIQTPGPNQHLPTYEGTANALRALAWAAAITGTDLIWPELDRLMKTPQARDVVKDFKKELAQNLPAEAKLDPNSENISLGWRATSVFPDWLRAQLVHLMATRGDEEGLKLAGLNRAAILGAVDESMTEVWRLPHWRETVETDWMRLKHKRGWWDYQFPYIDVTLVTTYHREVYQRINEVSQLQSNENTPAKTP